MGKRLTVLALRAKLASMKRAKSPAEKTTDGTVLGAKYRARCNQLTDSQREKLGKDFLKLYYSGSTRQPARRH